MNAFSQKTDLTLLIVSTAAFIASVIVIAYSAVIFTFIQNLIETKVLHRPLNPAMIRQKITPFIGFPVFTVIFFDALFFVKFSKKAKIILIVQFFIAAALLTAVCAFSRCIQNMDSDMASEIMLAKECFTHKTFWPRSWYYSTEFRLLNTQLIASPLFAFTSSWLTVKAVSSIILCFALPLSLWFLLGTLGVKTLWVKLLCSLFVFMPWSAEMWYMVQFGNYYIPHIAISFIYTGLFLSLVYSELSEKRRKTFCILFFALALVSGASGIRYILNFQLPIAVAIVSCAVYRLVNKKEAFDFSRFFKKDKSVFYAVMNIFASGFGYIVNSSVLSKVFHFLKYNDKKFNAIGDVSFSDVYRAVFEIFGYRNDVLVFSPAGINNVMLYIAFIFFIVCFIVCIKKYESVHKRFFFIITAVMIVLNSFAIIHIEYGERYFIPSLVYCVPCFALFLESPNLSALKKYLAGLSLSVVLIAGAFITYIDILTSDGNLDKHAVCRFLDDNYDFGYATFWNANIFTMMTDGRLEFGNLYPDTIDGVDYIPEKFQCHLWLTPERFYRDDYKANESVFFLVTQKEYDDSPERVIFKNGKQVYSDDFYRVFEFKNKKAFIDGF